MLAKILQFNQSSENFDLQYVPTLHLPKETYEDYLAFLFENNEEISSDDHTTYLQKMVFDIVVENFDDEELLLLQQKQDLYMCYIMHSTYKNSGLVSQQQFLQNLAEVLQYYSPTEDERNFLQKIQGIVQSTLVHQKSPFSYLQVCKDLFSEKLQLKLIDILKFMIGDSFCYQMSPASIFGICLQWTVEKYSIKNLTISELIDHLIDLKSAETCQKILKLAQMMNQIMNTKPIP